MKMGEAQKGKKAKKIFKLRCTDEKGCVK